MKNKKPPHPLDGGIERISSLLEHLVAIEMYRGGATQSEIAINLSMSVGKVNKFVKGIKNSKENHGEK